MSTTLTLSQDIWIGGVKQLSGSSIIVTESLAAQLISENKAIRPTRFQQFLTKPAQLIYDINNNGIGLVSGSSNVALSPIGKGSISTNKPFPVITGAAAASYSFLAEITSDDSFDFVRLAFMNTQVSSVVIDKVKVAVADGLGNDGTALTWVNVTFDNTSGAAGGDIPLITTGATLAVSVPAATGAGVTLVPGIAWSDWIAIKSIARSDLTRFPVLQVRAYTALGGAIQQSVATGNAAYDAASNKKWRMKATAGDLVTTPSGSAMIASVAGTWSPCSIAQFAHRVTTVQVGIFGDSIDQGQLGATPTTDYYGYGVIATDSKSLVGSARYSLINYSLSGQTTAQSWLWTKQYIPNSGLDYAIFHTYSPNDAVPNGNGVSMQYVTAFVNLCRKHNIIPIIRGSIPYTSLNAAQDAFRLADNLEAQKYCLTNNVIYLDANSALTDGETPQRIIGTYSTDGIHPNLAGHQLIAAKLALLL